MSEARESAAQVSRENPALQMNSIAPTLSEINARAQLMILNTAKRHFDEDVSRASVLLEHAQGLPDGLLKSDVLRSAWMVSVGASDAFFCDAYADLVTRTVRAKDFQNSGIMPDRLKNLSVPVAAVLDASSSWRWRMAARTLIEKQSVLSLNDIKTLLNLFCRDRHRLVHKDTIANWISHTDAKQRHFGISRAEYNTLTSSQKRAAKENALKHYAVRMQNIFQRRHDCIHNCDRPKSAIQAITVAKTEKAIADVSFLVERCTEHLRNEYPEYLRQNGYNGVTRNRVTA